MHIQAKLVYTQKVEDPTRNELLTLGLLLEIGILEGWILLLKHYNHDC